MTNQFAQEFIAQVLKVPAARITAELAYGEIPEWDSVGHFELMSVIEARFGLTIDEDLMIELTSVAQIAEFLAANSQQRMAA